MAPFLPDDQKLAAIREALPATSAGIYLDTPTCGPLPNETAAAMSELRDWGLRLGRAGPAALEEHEIRWDEARAAAAAVITADPEAITLTHGASDGLRAILEAVRLEPGQRILVSSLSAPGTAAVAGRFAADHGAEAAPVGELPPSPRGRGTGRAVRAASESAAPDVTDSGALDPDAIVGRLTQALSGGRTRLVVVPHVSPLTGIRLPVERLAAAAHQAGALVVADGAQAAGAIPVDVEALGVDAYVLTGETWLLGPQGIGAVWRAGALGRQLDIAPGTAGPGPEGSGHELATVVGFARSCSWLSIAIGLAWIHERTARMARRARALLAQVPGVVVHTPDTPAGIVTFSIGGWPAGQALEELGRRTFAIASTVEQLDAIRLGAAFFTTEPELERFRDGVAGLAAHTPESLPRPRRLTILGAEER